MSEINCPIVSSINKIRNPDKILKGVSVAILFDSLPEMAHWNQSLLDMATKTFLNNLVYALGKRGASIKVSNEKDSLVNLMTTSAWKRYAADCGEASFEEVAPSEIFKGTSVVIGLGVKAETLIGLSQPLVIIKTAKNEIFPPQAKVVAEEVDFAVNPTIKAIQELLKL